MAKKNTNSIEAKLVKRISSLEDYLGVVFAPGDGEDAYAQHVTAGNYSLERRVERLGERVDVITGSGSKGTNPR